MDQKKHITEKQGKIIGMAAAGILLLAVCLFAHLSNAFQKVLTYMTDRFFCSLLPAAYYGEDVSFTADIRSEFLPAMAELEIEEDESYDDFGLADNRNQGEDLNGDKNETASAEPLPDASASDAEDGSTTEQAAEDTPSEEEILPAESFHVLPVSYNGTTYSMAQIADYDFLVNNVFAIDKSASVTDEEMDGANLMAQDMSIDLSGEDYKVLIYHTHGSEAFADSREGVIEDTIIGVGDTLTQLLEEYGIKVYHDRTVYDVVNGKLDRSYAYDLASEGIDRILAEHPSIEVVIDLHRDGVRDDVHLVTDIDGRPTAKIMFLNGVSRSRKNGDLEHLYNPNKIANLAFSLQMYLEGKKISNDYVRKIYVKMYRFNLEKRPRSTLIEAGAQTNTLEEEKNAMIPLAAILYSVLSGGE